MSDEKELREHLIELRKRVIRIGLAIIIVSAVSLTMGVKEVEINGLNIWILYPQPFNNVAIQLTSVMKEDLVPSQVELIQIAPGQAFFAQFHIAVLLGIIFGMPVIARELAAFIAPALHENEKGTIGKITMPIIGLFATGCLFAYFVAIPFIVNLLYYYGASIGVITFWNITEFISFTMQFMLAFGLSFQLPVVMWAVTMAGLVEPKFWRSNLRYAVFILIFFGAIITPDGSGVTMWFISLPMLVLYVLGMFFVESKVKKSPEVRPS